MGYSTWTLSGLTLNMESINSIQIPGTIKQKVGKVLVKHAIVGRNVMDWELDCTGILTGTNKANEKADLESLRSNLSSNALVNGMHDGNYIVEQLSFDDSGDIAEGFYRYKIKLVEYQQ